MGKILEGIEAGSTPRKIANTRERALGDLRGRKTKGTLLVRSALELDCSSHEPPTRFCGWGSGVCACLPRARGRRPSLTFKRCRPARPRPPHWTSLVGGGRQAGGRGAAPSPTHHEVRLPAAARTPDPASGRSSLELGAEEAGRGTDSVFDLRSEASVGPPGQVGWYGQGYRTPLLPAPHWILWVSEWGKPCLLTALLGSRFTVF